MTHILVITGDFYQEISEMLILGAITTLKEKGATFDLVSVPGAFEIPGVISFALANKQYDGFVALGCVIRGETSHYDYVCGESARGLMDLAIKKQVPIGYGILTVETMEQAVERADITQGNKGHDAATACLRMLELKRQFDVMS